MPGGSVQCGDGSVARRDGSVESEDGSVAAWYQIYLVAVSGMAGVPLCRSRVVAGVVKSLSDPCLRPPPFLPAGVERPSRLGGYRIVAGEDAGTPEVR